MTEAQSQALWKKWGAALNGLPYFHMREGHHKLHPKIYSSLRELITADNLIAGFYSALHVPYFDKLTSQKVNGQSLAYWFGGSYNFCLRAYMRLVGDWLKQNIPNEDRVVYFFDSGDSRAGEADMFLKMLVSDKRFQAERLASRFESHQWQDSKTATGRVLQPSDILAWHFNYYFAHDRQMLPEGKQITRQVKVLYQHYLDKKTIFLSIEKTLALEKQVMIQRAGKLGRRPHHPTE